jgi:hypothetical protein
MDGPSSYGKLLHDENLTVEWIIGRKYSVSFLSFERYDSFNNSCI